MPQPSGGNLDRKGAGDPVRGRLLLEAVHFVARALALAAEDAAEPPLVADDAPPLNPDKVRCEAAMLLRAAAAVPDHDPVLVLALARLAASLAEPGVEALSVRLCLNPGIALDLALVPLHLRALGLGDQRLEPLLGDLLGTDRLSGPERVPHRQLEQLWLHGLWSGEPEPAAVRRALSASSLAHSFDHLAGTTEDAYAFTHAILYASDGGRRRVALPRPVEELAGDADAILAVALDAGNHDVAAEVLWAWPMLDLPLTPLAAEARTLLAQVADGWGFLPGPGFDPSVHRRLRSAQREAYELRTSYHTTLVHGLLLATALGRDDADRPTPATAGTGHAARAIAGLLAPSTRAAAWWARFAALAVDRKDALAPALVAMALRRAVSAADLQAVQDTLDLVGQLGLCETAVTRQARVLLRRAMRCTALAGAHAYLATSVPALVQQLRTA